MEFSDKLVEKAITAFNGELGWKKRDVFLAIDELIRKKIAILGGDVWVIYENGLQSERMTKIDSNKIDVGIIKGKDGEECIFNWYSNKEMNETWDEYVLRTKRETIESINSMNAEENVSPELADSIYYNLVFANKEEHENLGK